MSRLHPHWHSTDEQIVPIRTGDGQYVTSEAKLADRRPAAIVGILLIVGLGYMAIQGPQSLLGQTMPPPSGSTIAITAAGVFDPKTLAVEPGQTIRWINNHSIAHILVSDSLKDDKGTALHTTTLFPGAQAEFTIPASAQPGTHQYYSLTSADAAGQLVIGQATRTPPQEAAALPGSAPQVEEDGPTLSVQNEPEEVTAGSAPQSGSPSLDQGTVSTDGTFSLEGETPTTSVSSLGASVNRDVSLGDAGVARNPYTVDSTSTHPFVTETLHAGAPRPDVQPSTGPEAILWLVSASSLAAVAFASRKALRLTK